MGIDGPMGSLEVELAMRGVAGRGVIDLAHHEQRMHCFWRACALLCTDDAEQEAVEGLIAFYGQATGGLPAADDIVPNAETEPISPDTVPEA